MRHLVVTRFAVPRNEPDTLDWYRDPAWIERRLELFRHFFVPSVQPTGVPAVLLCGSAVADRVAQRLSDLPWVRVEVQDDWHGGWTAEPDVTLTRLDSDDAVHAGWFDAVDRAPASAQILLVREQLRFEPTSGRLHRLRRREPGPLAAFRGGVNPYSIDHRHLAARPDAQVLPGTWLLQIVHGGNVKNRRLKAWRFDRRAPRAELAAFGQEAAARS